MIQIEEARRTTALRFATRLDDDTRARARHAGIDPARQILARHHSSRICRTLVIDGETVAIGGIVASLLGPAEVWVALNARNVNRFAMIRALQGELDKALTKYGTILATVAADDERGKRFAAFFGFRLDLSPDPDWLLARIDA